MNEDTKSQPTGGNNNGQGPSESTTPEDQGNPATQQMRAVGRRRREAEEKLRQAVEGRPNQKGDASQDAGGPAED